MYKLIPSAKDTVDLSIEFDRYRDSRQRELTNNKSQKDNFNLRNYLKDVFGFAEHQEGATYDLDIN